MLIDHSPSQQHAVLQHAVLQLQQEVSRTTYILGNCLLRLLLGACHNCTEEMLIQQMLAIVNGARM